MNDMLTQLGGSFFVLVILDEIVKSNTLSASSISSIRKGFQKRLPAGSINARELDFSANFFLTCDHFI